MQYAYWKLDKNLNKGNWINENTLGIPLESH